jgi:hypothetical protein
LFLIINNYKLFKSGDHSKYSGDPSSLRCGPTSPSLSSFQFFQGFKVGPIATNANDPAQVEVADIVNRGIL